MSMRANQALSNLPEYLSSTTSALIEILQQRELITDEGIERVQAAALAHGIAFSTAATRLGVVSERDMAQTFAGILGVAVLTRAEYPQPPHIPNDLNLAFLRKHRVCPVMVSETYVRLAMANPQDNVAIAGIRFALGKDVEPVAALESDIDEYLQAGIADISAGTDNVTPGASSAGDDIDKLSDHDSDAPAIRMRTSCSLKPWMPVHRMSISNRWLIRWSCDTGSMVFCRKSMCCRIAGRDQWSRD